MEPKNASLGKMQGPLGQTLNPVLKQDQLRPLEHAGASPGERAIEKNRINADLLPRENLHNLPRATRTTKAAVDPFSPGGGNPASTFQVMNYAGYNDV